MDHGSEQASAEGATHPQRSAGPSPTISCHCTHQTDLETASRHSSHLIRRCSSGKEDKAAECRWPGSFHLLRDPPPVPCSCTGNQYSDRMAPSRTLQGPRNNPTALLTEAPRTNMQWMQLIPIDTWGRHSWMTIHLARKTAYPAHAASTHLTHPPRKPTRLDHGARRSNWTRERLPLHPARRATTSTTFAFISHSAAVMLSPTVRRRTTAILALPSSNRTRE